MLKIAIIGKGSQSKRIQTILKKLKYKYLLFKPMGNKNVNKKNFNEVEKCNTIFICSPNNTHYFYIKKLYKKRYIFCEKPPVSNIREFNLLKKIKSKKIYFNYNFRFSMIAKILANIKKYNLGKLIYANIIIAHGLASKEIYKKNWRSKYKKCPKGVFEVVSIHVIDLINYFFKIKKINTPKLINLSKVGSSFDTSMVKLNLNDNATIDIFTTYYAPLFNDWTMIFRNGIIKFEHSKIIIRGPRDSFDKKGFFILPKIKKEINIFSLKDYNSSIFDSVTFFLKSCKTKKNFSNHHTKSSLKSNLLIL